METTERLHFHFPALKKEMATHSSVLAWRIPGMGEPGGLPSMGSHRVGHDCSDSAAVTCLICMYLVPFHLPFHMALQHGPCYCQLSCHDNHMPEFLRDSTVSNNISQQILIFSHPEKVPNCFACPSTTHSRDTNVLCQIMCLDICLTVYGHWID